MSEVVPLQACPEIEVWWHHDDERRPDAKLSAVPGTVSAAVAAAVPAAAIATLRDRPFASRRQDHHAAVDARERGAIIDSSVAPPVKRGAGRILLALVLGFVAVGLAVVGLTVNTRFAASFGQTAEAAMLLAAIGLTIDLLAIALPSAAAQFWRDRNLMAASAAWAIWLIALGMTLLAAIGFAATNIGDGVAGRSRLAAETSALTADVIRLRSERAAIAEQRSVATLAAEIQRAQPAAAAVWKQTSGCSDVTLAASGAACAEVLKLRQALGAAQRRDTLDAELRAAEARLAPLPAIVTADPQATMAADILAWISAGRVNLTPHDIHRLRITGLTVIPALAGIIFLFATTLMRAPRRRAGT
ncbi:MAG: hypothetical protein K2Y71_10790 [Xanthobacteraceae bacterium]|nr:hypothetical protein [Xanthobacteraceae bacterium]